MIRPSVILAIASAALLASCSLLSPVDYLTNGGPVDGGSDGTAGNGTPGDGAPGDGAEGGETDGGVAEGAAQDGSFATTDGACPALPGPAMVRVDSYCIDSTEVTSGQYLAFMDASAGDAGPWRTAPCGWNDDLTPHMGDSWPPAPGEVSYPVQAIDWCDAVAYCTWAGKHLCGHVNAAEKLTPSLVADAGAAEWFRACSHDGDRTYPYGSTLADVCAAGHDSYGGPQGVALVGSMRGCEGGYPGLFDMSGNVREWIDACESDEPDARCVVQGGMVSDYPADSLTCAGFPDREARNATWFGDGFRCCARLP